MERKELKATSPSGNPDYQYYLKNEADLVMNAMEARIEELEEENRKLLQSESWKMQQLRSELSRAEYLADEYGR